MANSVTPLRLEDNKSQDFLNGIVKEICKMYKEERLKGKDTHSILDKLKQFLTKKNQKQDNIINFFLDGQTEPIIQNVLASCYIYGKWVEKGAFNCYKKFTEMGNTIGISNVGNCCQNGMGVEKDERKTFEYYLKSAEIGNAIGISNVGNCYQNGIGVEKDEHKVSEYYQKLTVMEICNIYEKEKLKGRGTHSILNKLERFLKNKIENQVKIINFLLYHQNDPMFQNVLASCYHYGKWVEKDEYKAFNCYKKSAEMGNAIGMSNVGNCYQNGIGVEKDECKAFEYYLKSAKMGNAIGKSNVGNCYQNGIGVEKDERKASEYYLKSTVMEICNLYEKLASEYYLKSTKMELCNIYEKEKLKGRGTHSILDKLERFLTKKNPNQNNIINFLLDDQNPMVQNVLASCYRYGKWVEKDEEKAFICYKKSADMGNAIGKSNVGNCYQNGIGVEKDEYKAFDYYLESVKMENACASSVGFCYHHGIGVEKNEREAFEYYKKAAELDNSFGLYNLGECYLNGSGVEKDLNKAFDYFKKSADLKNVAGFNMVGHCYRNGIGTERNLIKANYWYRRERNKCLKIIKSEYKSLNINAQLKKILEKDKYRISWIPYSEFEIIEQIGEGGFATVHRAKWLKRTDYYIKPIHVALKKINGSSNQVEDFINELKTYCEIGINNPTFLKCYGISQDEETKNYIIILKYAKAGSLDRNIAAISRMSWKDKLNLLICIVSDLESIHSEELCHGDLHSKNILQDYLCNAYIADLGLSLSVNKEQKYKTTGIMPYVAPEVLLDDKYTQSADVYSLGIIMTEIATGKRAFDGELCNTRLSTKICHRNERPEFNKDTPECYVKLAERCMDSDPKKRPTATIIKSRIVCWLDDINQNKDNEIKKQFLEADNNNEFLIHSDKVYE